MGESAKRTDDLGRAYAGSQLQVQIYVARRQAELSAAVASAIGRADLAGHLRWVAPLEERQFAEPYDGRFMEVLGLAASRQKLAAFWPAGGPHWDALAVAGNPETPNTILLIEGKSYPAEVVGPGCLATDPASAELISHSLEDARSWFRAQPATDWKGPLYQFANRLAHVLFFHRELGIPTWLVNLCFTGDSSTTPTSEGEWRAALPSFKKQLGFPDGQIPWVADAFLPARQRIELVGG